MAADHRTMVDALLEQEARQVLSTMDSSRKSTSRLNSSWRQKVVQWYFTLVGALDRKNTTSASSNGTSRSPFNKMTVHISAYILDNYLMSLPQEQAIRYRNNRQAYQLLATSCLLLGIRIAQHNLQTLSSAQDVNNKPPAEEQRQQQSCGMKRAKKCTDMSSMDSGPSPPSSPGSSGVAIPNAAAILRMSAAPNSITEQNVLDMVKKLTSSRSFPRSKVVTTLDYIHALSAPSTQVSQDGQSISLGPRDAKDASRIADTLLSDVNIVSTLPSVVACAIITLVLSRSNNTLNNLDKSSIRQRVYYSIFGTKVDPELHVATLKAEATVQVGVTAVDPPPRRRCRSLRLTPPATHHIIPFD